MISRISEDAYQAARRHAAFIERLDRGRIVVSGRDRATYLQGLLTNDITALKPGEGCYTAYLTPQGRMIADLFVYELGDLMLLTMPLELKDVVLAKLDQFIFTEDVQLGDVTATFDTGAYASWGPTVANRVPVHAMGPYVVPNVRTWGEAFFTNVVLLACFLGMSIGCLAARRPQRYLTWTPALLALAVLAAHTVDRLRNTLMPLLDVGGQASPQLVFFGADYHAHDVVDWIRDEPD